MTSIQNRFKLRPSRMVVFILFITIAGILAMIALQRRTNHWIYSLSNFEAISADLDPNGAQQNVTTTGSATSIDVSNNKFSFLTK